MNILSYFASYTAQNLIDNGPINLLISGSDHRAAAEWVSLDAGSGSVVVIDYYGGAQTTFTAAAGVSAWRHKIRGLVSSTGPITVGTADQVFPGSNGPKNHGNPRIGLASTTILAALAAVAWFTNSPGAGPFTVSKLTVEALAGLTPGDGTDFASVVITHYSAAGSLLSTTTVPLSTVGTNHTGAVSAHGDITVTLGTPVVMAEGDSAEVGLTKAGAGLVTPALVLTLG